VRCAHLGRDLSVRKKESVLLVAVAFAVALILFDIDFNPELAMSREIQQLDSAQEARFSACVDEKDGVVHGEIFGNVDNPDVQREMLMTRKEQLVRACRDKFPETRVTVREPFRFNLLDVKFRY
jgi:hypothetical protein